MSALRLRRIALAVVAGCVVGLLMAAPALARGPRDWLETMPWILEVHNVLHMPAWGMIYASIWLHVPATTEGGLAALTGFFIVIQWCALGTIVGVWTSRARGQPGKGNGSVNSITEEP